MYNVLVTGVGAIIGYGIIKSLRQSKYEVNIIGTDIYEDAIGQQWCDKFEIGMLANDPLFPQFLASLIKKHNIHLVIPGIEQDISRISADIHFFKEMNVKFVLNNAELLSVANDKWDTHLKLLDSGVKAIPSYIEGEFEDIASVIGVPLLLKPRRSYASKGILEIHNQVDFIYWKNKLATNFMVQKIIGDSESEFTVGAFVTKIGNTQKIILQRKLSGEGSTAKAKVVFNEELSKIVDHLIGIFKPEGPTNFQFRYEDGYYYLLEINPRISSSTSLRTAFGFNEAEMCIQYYLENQEPHQREIKQGNAIRFIEDWVHYDSDNI